MKIKCLLKLKIKISFCYKLMLFKLNLSSRHEKSSNLCQDYNELKYRCDVAENKCKVRCFS